MDPSRPGEEEEEEEEEDCYDPHLINIPQNTNNNNKNKSYNESSPLHPISLSYPSYSTTSVFFSFPKYFFE